MISTITSTPVGTEHSVISEGYRLYIWEKCLESEQQESLSGTRAALLVHGGTYSGPTDYDIQVPGKDYSLMDYLARRGFDVFTFAVRGYGRSERPDDPSIVTTDAGVRDTEAVIEHICQLRGVSSVDLLGWSWGGRMTSLYTTHHPERVRHLILFAGGAGSVLSRNRVFPTDPWTVITRENIMARIEQEHVIPDMQEAFIKAALGFDIKSPNIALRIMRGNSEPAPVAPEDITVPTQIIYGALDEGWQPDNVSNFFARLNTPDKALTVFPDSGHFLFLQKPRARFFNAVEQWFSQE